MGDRVERTGGVAEIALTILCMIMALLPGLSARIFRIVWFFSTLISWICYGLAFYVIGFSFSPQPLFSEVDPSRSAQLACSAILFVGLANSIVCRRIPDPNHHLCASYQQLAQMVLVLVLILSPWSVGIGPRLPFWLLLSGALFLLWLAQERSRLLSASARSCTKDKEDLLISEYMAKRHSDGTGDPSDCHYIVDCQFASTTWAWFPSNFGMDQVPRRAGKYSSHVLGKGWQIIKNLLLGAPSHHLQYASTSGVTRYDKLVTVQDIWKHIPPSVGGKLVNGRDVCLSFALFKLLRRRFRGCNLLHESAREFALQGLLSSLSPPKPLSSSFSSSSSKASSPRAFDIIEAELGFLFDFFYGNHSPDFYCLLSAILFIECTIILSVGYYYKFRDEDKTHGTHKIATVVTILFMFPLLGAWQLLLAISNWHKVTLLVHICRGRKLRSSSSHGSTFGGAPALILRSLLDMILGRLVLLFPCRSSLSNKVWQYCLLQQGDSSRFATRQFPAKAKEALVNALLDALRHRDGVLSDGQSSLSKNGQYDKLSWACHQEFVAEKIIVWHVATTLCHVGYAPRAQTWEESQGKKKDEDHEVATVLSGYCAYLVGFAPQLIADDIYATRLVFDNACAAATERVQGEGSPARMCKSAKSMTFGSSDTDSAAATQLDVVSQGKLLAAQLLNLQDHEAGGLLDNDTDILWTVLADFWAELMLFISPADNAAAHLEKLKTGGELITHIWALLTHAGILERSSTKKDYEANQTSQLLDPRPSDAELV